MNNEAPTELVRCTTCGWVYYPMSQVQAEEAVTRFNRYYDRLPPEKRATYSRRSSLATYLVCNRCKGKTFERCAEDACPAGATLLPIVFELNSEV